MKIVRIFFTLLVCFGLGGLLEADPRRCLANDTVVATNNDQNDLMNYLKGTWNISGSWQIEEGQGKIRQNIRARLTGTESFTMILNGHFMQKELKARVKYNSRDLGKSVQNSFSAMTIMTFNNNLNKFFSWYYDCSGAFMESDGTFNSEDNRYFFQSKIIDTNHREIEHMYTITIVDDDHYRWEVKQRKDSTNDWEVASTGLSTRKR
ncbi:MAG: hypothetical protein S4CHLAM6_14250 [Chlamydiae bacterium]|nr:hypothetical protein [Chlamydiota bacterium]